MNTVGISLEKACRTLLVIVLIGSLFIQVSHAARKEGYFRIIDSSAGGFGYAYAPSMVFDPSINRIHCWVGSSGTGSLDWDHIRYSYSDNGGTTWSSPVNQIVGSTYDRCACDPSVVQWTDGYWYNFYSGCPVNVQTAIFVARASSPNGTWYKYTQRGTWEQNPSDPKVIIWPKISTPDNGGYYGAGQASVVRYNNRLYMWYYDDSKNYPNGVAPRLWMTSTTNPISWPSGTECTGIVDAETCSGDVKWDPYVKSFVFYTQNNRHNTPTYMRRYYSRNGLQWQGPYNTDGQLPAYSHNVGVLGNRYGHMCLNGTTIYAFGCPWDLAPNDVWAQWDVYGFYWRDMIPVKGDFDGDGKLDSATVDARQGKWYIRSSATGQLGVPGIPWGWQWPGQTERHRIACADYDGDGITEAAIIDDWAVPGTTGSRWYVYQCNNNEVPWGWQWTGMGAGHELIVDDYSGDGKADRAICDPDASGGTRYYVINSANGGGGVPGISWGAQIPGQTRTHTLICGDYDGDNKADRAFLDPFGSSGSKWYVVSTATGQPPADIPWGWEWAGTNGLGWIPVIEDWDNDNKVQRALLKYPESDGSGSNWYIIGGSDYSWPWKANGMTSWHQPIAGDYDNNGRAAVGVRDQDADNLGACWYVLDADFPWGWKVQIAY